MSDKTTSPRFCEQLLDNSGLLLNMGIALIISGAAIFIIKIYGYYLRLSTYEIIFISLITACGLRLITGLQNRCYSGSEWIVFSAIFSILYLLSCFLYNSIISPQIAGLFFPIDIFLQGISWVAVGIGLRNVKKATPPSTEQ